MSSSLLPSRLRELRKVHGLNQEEVADTLGISKAMYCRIEKGERGISNEMLTKLSLLYHSEPKELQGLALADEMSEAAGRYEDEVVSVAFKALKIKKTNSRN